MMPKAGERQVDEQAKREKELLRMQQDVALGTKK